MSESSLVEVSDTELIYKGMRYVADPNIPNRISVYLIKDNHTTLTVHGQTEEEILERAKVLVNEHSDANCGILFLMFNRKEIKRYFFFVNVGGVVLHCKDKSLEELLKLDEVKHLLTTNPKL